MTAFKKNLNEITQSLPMVGEYLYSLTSDDDIFPIKKLPIVEISISQNRYNEPVIIYTCRDRDFDDVSFLVRFDFEELGKSVFVTKEEAKEAFYCKNASAR